MIVESRYKHVKIQHLGSRPYIPEALHVILDQRRTDHTIANILLLIVEASTTEPVGLTFNSHVHLLPHDMKGIVPPSGPGLFLTLKITVFAAQNHSPLSILSDLIFQSYSC